MTEREIEARLVSLREEGYRRFQAGLMPTVREESILGVRTPLLRQMAAQLLRKGEEEAFLQALPHRYYEENNLHALLINGTKDPALCRVRLSAFLPHVDNWATCDMLRPKAIYRDGGALMRDIVGWLATGQCYTVRFGIGMLMTCFLEERYDDACSELAAAVDCREYYVSMMAAWYFATALAKQYERVLPYFEERRLDPVTQNRAIAKACESLRVPQAHKDYLKTLKVR